MLELAKRGLGFWGGGNSIFRRQAMEEVGGFNINIDTGEDFDLAKKLHLRGYKVIFYNDYVYHDTFRTLKEFLRKDIRRSKNFKYIGINQAMGLSISILFLEHIKILLEAITKFFKIRKYFFIYVPIIIILRMLIYAIVFLFP